MSIAIVSTFPIWVVSDIFNHDWFDFRKSSGVLSSFRQRQQDHKPLPHLHSIVFNARNSPVFVVSEKPTIYLLSSIVHFFNNMTNATALMCNADWLNDKFVGYMENFAKNTDWSFATNWFLRREITFVLDLLKSTAVQQRIDKRLQLMVAYKVLCCLDDTQLNDILHIFSRFIFNIDLYEHKLDVTSMDDWKSLYAKVCVEHYLNSLNEEVSACGYRCRPNEQSKPYCFSFCRAFHRNRFVRMCRCWRPIGHACCCWKCTKRQTRSEVLSTSVSREQRSNNSFFHFLAFSIPEGDTIRTTLSFLLLQNANDIKILNKTEQFLYTLIAFLGKENTFLDADVNQLLTRFVRNTFNDPKIFDFDANLNRNLFYTSIKNNSTPKCIDHIFLAEKFNFENLYISFLDQFQGCSYGDKTFGALVMVPLAQKHNIKWRHMLWSEHVHVLRFVACTEDEVSDDLVIDSNDVRTNGWIFSVAADRNNGRLLGSAGMW